MSPKPDIALTTIPSDIELDMMDNEPPGLFPGDQSSYWGSMRAVFAANMQVLADQMTQWYQNIDPQTTDETDMSYWEDQEGLPVNPTGLTLEDRRSRVLARRARGAFTRTRRRGIVEAFIYATFGIPVTFTAEGLALTSDGLILHGEFGGDVTALYEIVEDIPNFTYTVYILTDVDADEVGLTRELERITPSGITFDIQDVDPLP